MGKGYQDDGELADVYKGGDVDKRNEYVQDSIFGGFFANLVQLKSDVVDLEALIHLLRNFSAQTPFFDATSLDHVDFLFAAASLRAF